MKQELPVFSNLSKFPNLIIAISTKKDGEMKACYDLDEDNIALGNREKFLRQYGINTKDVVIAGLTHGDNIEKVSKFDVGKVIENIDSLITNEKKVFLSITTADCLSIFIYDPKKNAIGLIHAGWRGLAQNIVDKTIIRMERDFGSYTKDMLGGVGPGIGICHFEVKKDVEVKFKNYHEAIEKRNGKIFIDLKKIAFRQLLEQGLKKENIEINPECTFHEEEKYFSYRRDRALPLKAQLVVMGLN